MRDIGQHKKSGRQMPTSKRRIEGREMKILTPVEKAFLDVFLHEATTAPFRGPATEVLHALGGTYQRGWLATWPGAFYSLTPLTSDSCSMFFRKSIGSN